MKPARTLLACIAIGLSFLPVQAQFQVVHDVPNTTTTPELTPLILGDGSTVTRHWDAGEHIFRKYDSNGDLIWTKAMAGSSVNLWSGGQAIVMLNDGNDGFRFIRLIGITETPLDSVMPEDANVVEFSFQIAHVDGNGEVTDAFQLSSTVQPVPANYSSLAGLNVVGTPDNGMVLAISMNAPAPTIDLVKIAANGTTAWSRSVGRTAQGTFFPHPTFAFDSNPIAHVAVSGSGRIYYSEISDYPYTNLRLAELGSNGDMLWMKRYIYGNTNPFIEFHNIQVDGAGNVHAAGSLSSSVGRFHIILRTNADGVLDRGDLYRTTLAILSGEFRLDTQGRRYHLVSTHSLTPGSTQGILVADTLGTPAQFLRRDDQVVLPNNVFIVPKHMDVAGNRLAFSGLLNHEHVDLAYTTRYETLSSIGTDEVSSCLMDDTTFAHIQIPLNIMTTEYVPDAASIDVSAYYSSQPLALTLTDLGTEPLEPLCTFINELLQNDVGVIEGSLPVEAPLVVSSLVAQGTPLVISDRGVSVVEVFTIYGALVQRSSLAGDRSIPTTGWATGTYILHALDGHGAPLRSGRVAVQ